MNSRLSNSRPGNDPLSGVTGERHQDWTAPRVGTVHKTGIVAGRSVKVRASAEGAGVSSAARRPPGSGPCEKTTEDSSGRKSR